MIASKAPERAQLEIIELTHGLFAFPTSIFQTESAARDAWANYKAMLLASSEPGSRPRGFWLFEVGIRPPARWFDELSALLDRNLISDEEAQLIELQTGILCATQTAQFLCDFESAANVRSLRVGPGSLRYLRYEFQAGVRWHGWRGRPELEAKYWRLAAVMDAVIEGREEL